jgi:Leucine-rich repeat (LRR) protein
MSEAEEAEVEQHTPVPLTLDHIKSGLSQIGKTFDGSSVSFIKLDLENKELDIASDLLRNYQNLRHLNLSGNHFEDISVVSSLPYILKLDIRGNRLSSLSLFNDSSTFLYLQHLNLSKNQITTLTSLSLPKLQSLNLSQNQISKISDFSGHGSLKSLDLRGNKLTSLEGLNDLTALEELYAAENAITSIHGIKNAGSLKRLHLRKNALAGFEAKGLPALPNLVYLNFRENEVTESSSIGNLEVFPQLVKIVVADNPIKPEPSGDVKKEVLIVLPQLKFIGKEEVTAEEREEAIAEAAERKRLAEEARLEAERAAKEALESGEVKEGEED